MLLFFGLGNNDNKYLKTKHNVGRILVENLAREFNINWESKAGFYFSKSTLENKLVGLIYSSGYMNNSGQPLASFLNYYKIPTEDLTLIIVQDDSDQNVGCYKLAQGGRSAGHRGLDSIFQHSPGFDIKPEHIWRLKIGIRPIGNKLRSEHFVLQSLSNDEILILKHLSDLIINNLSNIQNNKFDLIQNKINAKKILPE